MHSVFFSPEFEDLAFFWAVPYDLDFFLWDRVGLA